MTATAAHSFAYIETDVPAGETLDDYRRTNGAGLGARGNWGFRLRRNGRQDRH